MDDEDDERGMCLTIAHAMLSREGTGPAWAIEIEDAGPGFSRVAMTLRGDMLNGHGSAHGGMIFALADTAFAYACNSRNQVSVAHQASITFVDAGRAGERLIAEARETAAKGRSGVYAVTVFGEDKRIIAAMQALSRTVGGSVIEVDGNGRVQP